MFLIQKWLLPIETRVFLILFVTLASLHGSVLAARYVPVKVFVNGKLILTGSASDDGRRDADEVWESLNRVELKESGAFRELVGNANRDHVELGDVRTTSSDSSIRVDVRYGGVADTRRLRLVRFMSDDGTVSWRIHSNDVERLFGDRMITRSAAKSLVNPKRDK